MGFTRQPRFFGLVLTFLLTWLAPMAHAASACEQAEQTLVDLEREELQLSTDRMRLQQILDGQVPAPHQLEELLGQPLGQPYMASGSPPAKRQSTDSRCQTIQNDIDALTEQLSALDRDLYELRHTLLAMSSPQRQALAQLSALHTQLQERIDDPQSSPSLVTGARLVQDHIARIWALLPHMAQAEAGVTADLDQLWHRPPSLSPPSPITTPYRDLIKARLEVQKQVRDLRADQWNRRHLTDMVVDMGGLTGIPAVLAREGARIQQRFMDTVTLVRYDLSAPIRRTGYMPIVQNMLALVLGIAGFVLLAKLAHRSRRWALSLHEKVVAASGQRRWLRNASRLISGIAPMLPWLLLWFFLGQLAPLLDSPSTKVLLWLLPFAHLYVIYGLASLVGEWLIGRVAQSANPYLSADQSRQVIAHSRKVAGWLIVPWFPLLVVWESLGPSLLYYLLAGLLGTSLYLAVGRLLALRSHDYLLCLQAILPSYLDPVAERLLTPWLFWLFAPLMLPVALVSFLVDFLDRVLADFDWYMRFKARWFRLRTKINNEEDDEKANNTDTPEEGNYERWFAQELPEDSKLPFIDTGLVAAMEKTIERWHGDKTDENALVVVGEKGSGKSISIGKLQNALTDSCEGLEVINLKVPARTIQPDDIHRLVGDALNTDLVENGPAALVKSDESRAPTLLILDEAQNFFLASQGGLAGWRTVLSLVNARLDNVFWLLMINNQSWAYLCNVFGRDYQFRNVVRVKRWGQSDIRSLILSRNHLSGYQVSYDEVLLSSRGPEAGNVRNAEQRYFSLLWDASRGNPLVALRLWLTSIKVQGRRVQVGLPTPPSAGILDTMGENALFVYAAIATHGRLSSSEISAATCLPENVVRYALKSGFDAGFLKKTDDNRYRLVPLWYQPVISYLTRKNLLNE